MTSLVLPRASAARSLMRCSPSGRVFDSDFNRGPTGCFNASLLSPGYGDSLYSIQSAGGYDAFGHLDPFGVPVLDIKEGQNYWLTAMVLGDAGPVGWNGPGWSMDSWGVVSGILRRLETKASLEYDHAGMLFASDTGLIVGRVTIDEVSAVQRAQYSDRIVASIGNGADVLPFSGTLDSRMAAMPETLAKLQANSGTIRIAMIGDSLMADTSRGSLPELIMRSYPGVTVEARLWSLGSHGVSTPEGDGWVDQDKSAIYEYEPNVIYQGGISDSYDTPADWATIIADYRANISGVEILVGGPTWALANDPEGTAADSAFMAGVAATNSVAFVDCGPAFLSWSAATGIVASTDNILRDPVHMNYLGVEPISRVVAWFFGASAP